MAARYCCDMPSGILDDVSTAVLIDTDGSHVQSTSVLRMFRFMGFPYNVLGPIALLMVPVFVRDFCYRLFARNRGEIWKVVRKMTGWGETKLEMYRDRIIVVGEEGEMDPGWGLEGGGEGETKDD